MNEALPPEQWKDHVDAWTPHLGRRRYGDSVLYGYRLIVGNRGERYVQRRRLGLTSLVMLTVVLTVTFGWFMGQGPRATWRDVLVGIGLSLGTCGTAAIILGPRDDWYVRDRVCVSCPMDQHPRWCVYKELATEARPLLLRCVFATRAVALVLRTDLCDRVLVVAPTAERAREREELARMFGALSAHCRVYPGFVFHGEGVMAFAREIADRNLPLLEHAQCRETGADGGADGGTDGRAVRVGPRTNGAEGTRTLDP